MSSSDLHTRGGSNVTDNGEFTDLSPRRISEDSRVDLREAFGFQDYVSGEV
jgi:hypothetical protein